MSEESQKKPKTGSELIESFFKQLNEDKDKYDCPAIVDIIINLHQNKKLSKTNIENALDEMRVTNYAKK